MWKGILALLVFLIMIFSATLYSQELNPELIVVSEPSRDGTVYLSGLAGAVVKPVLGTERILVLNRRTREEITMRISEDGGIPLRLIHGEIGDKLSMTLLRDGQPLGESEEFTVDDNIPPVVIASVPTNGDKDIIVDKVILIKFSEPVDANTVNENSYTLSNRTGKVSGAIELLQNNTVASITPYQSLTPLTEYTINVTTDVMDLQDNHMENPFTASFIVGEETHYTNGYFIPVVDMQDSRLWHSSCVIDGKIYVIGGTHTDQDLPLKTVEVYDPVLGRWAPKADMNTARCLFPACVVNGKIWALGGAERLWHSSIKSIEEYDPLTDTWTYVTDMPRVRQGHTAFLVNGKIYIIGGGTTWEKAIAEVDVYDTLTGSWTLVAPIPTPRTYLSAVVLNGKIYTIGGQEGKGSNMPITTAEVYDPVTDTWNPKANLITPRNYSTATVVNDKIYVIGGKSSPSGDCENFASRVEEYDPITDTWTERAKTPNGGLRAHSAQTLYGHVYVFGGGANRSCPPISLPTMYVYNPHHDLFPLIDNLTIDKSYTKPGTDSVRIITKMKDPTGITLLAEIEAPDQTAVDSLELFDDGNHNDVKAGDSLYANVWPVGSVEEQQYYVDLHVTRVDTNTLIHNMDNMTLFTTIGPVEFESYKPRLPGQSPEPGVQFKFKLTLKNKGLTTPAIDIEATISSLDSFAICTADFRSYPDIEPGRTSTNLSYYIIQIAADCPTPYQIPFKIDISSQNHIFWSDTFWIDMIVPGVAHKSNNIPATFTLYQNYPNPFNPTTTIDYAVPQNSHVEIRIFDLLGREVRTLVAGEQTAGSHQITWIGLDNTGSPVSSGVYFCTMTAEGFSETRKLLLLH